MADFTECDYCLSTNIIHLHCNDYECKDCGETYQRGMSDALCEQSFREMMDECGVVLGEDEIADRESYNAYTDGLCEDGQISDEQYNGMDNPF